MMNAQEIEASYRSAGGWIQSPGKFEGEHIAIVALWDLSLEGFDDETLYDGDMSVSVFLIDEALVTEFPYLSDTYAIALWESDQGFVNSVWLPSVQDLNGLRARLEATESEDIDA